MPRARNDVRWWPHPLLLASGLLAVTSLPYAYGFLSTPQDLIYTGLLFDVPDHAQYWSWVAASRTGLFISNTMTPEANAAVFSNPQMWVLAGIQRALDLTYPTLFQVWRVSAMALFLPLLVAFLTVMVSEPERRRTALWLALLGAGLGWVWVVVKYVTGAADVPWPQDLYTVEPNTFFAMLTYPHLLLAQALMLAAIVGAWLVYRGHGWPAYTLAVCGAVALSASHAYDLLTIFAVLGTYGALEWIRRRAVPWRLVGVSALMAAGAAPLAIYYQLLTTRNPLWSDVLAQYGNAGVWTPPHLHLVMLMGVPLLLAVAGVRPRDGWTDERRFLAVWAIVGLGLIYVPVVYQIKLLSAWQLPLAVLAAHAWFERVQPRLGSRLAQRAATASLLVFVSLTNVYLYAWRLVEIGRHTAPYYLHQDQMAALDWLSLHTNPSDVVMAPAELGQFVPNYGAARAYLAHWAMTTRFFERRAHVEQFFDAGASERWRQALLRHNQITLVLRSNWPTSPEPTFDPAQEAGYLPVFTLPEAQIYRVGSAAAPGPAAVQ